ncbi:Squamosa promoter-binding-like protein 7 [Platanthera zijinensis]|uniref:Squamosa promoter-binding-like protein 7 n=1 Tax=Platanthera zijinensis TaxID=2320716 RepID=A0AAP0BZY9_9ASPA
MLYYGDAPARDGAGDGDGSPTWGSYDPPAAGCAFPAETLSSSFSSYGAPAHHILSPSCTGFGDITVVPGGDHPIGHQYGYGKHQQPRPHPFLTCLKLGKRQYYGGAAASLDGSPPAAKRTAVPKCLAEGCNKALLDAKDYHKRHRVCAMHAKAPSVIVLGAEQRFCQQCSRFQPISEFDAAKRSCRRRLAGHNQRRRKTSIEPIAKNPSLESAILGSKFPYMSPDSSGRALSLLSSETAPRAPTPELSSRSSAALCELIADNRATIFGRQLRSDRAWQCSSLGWDPYQQQLPFQAPVDELAIGWNQFQESGNHVTLDLLQMPDPAAEFLPARNKPRDDEDECCEIWNFLKGTNVS